MEAESHIFPPPRQERSKRSLERFLDAAEQVILTDGLDGLNVSEVARLAGFSVGGLYSRFPNRLALLEAVRHRFLARVEAALEAEFAAHKGTQASLAEALETSIRLLFRHFLAEQGLFRAFFIETPKNPGFEKGGEKATAKRRALFREAIMAHAHEIHHPDPEAAIEWIFTVFMALMRERVVYGEGAGITGGYTDERLLSNLCRYGLFVLTYEEPSPLDS
jgi:AcrR family transcriptional regulator